MGFIAKRLISKHRRSRRKSGKKKIIDLSEMRLAREKIKEINEELENKLRNTTVKDPSQRMYFLVQNLLSHFSEEVSIKREFIEYYDKVVELEDEYMPSYPPMSPLTSAYFTYSCFCDLQFGKEKETIGTIFYDLGQVMNFDETMLLALENLNESYMGLYKHIGFDGDLIKLKEISTNREISCICTAGYKGNEGEIWLVRVVNNLSKAHDYGITLTTPYVILKYGEKDWKAFFERQGIIGEIDTIKKKQYDFFKHNPDFKYWHDYIMDGYVNHTPNNIYLTGMPDIKGSKPHELD